MKAIKASLLCFLSFVLGFSAIAMMPAPAKAAGVETQVQYLSGTDVDNTVNWDFMVSAGDRSSEGWTTLPVPSVWESHGFGVLSYGWSTANEVGSYKKNFTMPADWNGSRIFIVFEGSMTDTSVKINGVSAGPTHKGSFYQFKYDITDKVNLTGNNLLEVSVAKYSSNASVNAAEREADYWQFGGIYRPVYLEARPQQYIDRIAVDGKANGSFKVDVHTQGITSTNTIKAQIKTLDGVAVGSPMTASISAGATKTTLNTTILNPNLWTAETPNLYRVEVTLENSGTVVHKTAERFGFRTIEVRSNDGIYINGKKIIFKGANRHAFHPDSGRTISPAIDRADIELMKEMNMNTVRMSHYPPDQSFLHLADEMGMYVVNELAGWQKSYDTTVGTILTNEMVKRDVNHPSIIFWANGNEGGWNTALDPLFKQLDPQQRPLLHPWAVNDGIDSDHYEFFDSTKNKIEGTSTNVFMPTEFLHALYDGGAGAGLDDYWKYMGDVTKPKAAGGIIWALMDEGIKRQDGTIDVAGSNAPDGIVGPYRQKSGSFYTIKDIWSPVQLTNLSYYENTFPTNFSGSVGITNAYDYTNLNQLNYEWQLINFKTVSSGVTGFDTVASGTPASPNIPARTSGQLNLNLPTNWQNHDALRVIVKDSAGKEITSWTWMIKSAAALHSQLVTAGTGTVTTTQDANEVVVTAGQTVLKFSKSTGNLTSISQNGKPFSFNKGPILTAGTQTFSSISAAASGSNIVVTVNYTGNMNYAKWTVYPSGWVDLEYKYNLNGSYDTMGVSFSYPENKVQEVKWLGKGPFRVYKNRMRGPKLSVWNKTYMDQTIPFQYPEFNGYYSDTYWAVLKTAEGNITFSSKDENLFLRLFNPFFGNNPVSATAVMPVGDISFLDGISAIGNKLSTAADTGPQGEKNVAAGDYTRTISFKVDTSSAPATAGGNIAFNKPVTFSAQEVGSEASNIVDGTTTAKWSAQTYPQWAQIDLGQNYSIDKTELVPYFDRAYQYKVEVSTDGTNYTQVVDRTANTAGGSLLTDRFNTITARYVRLTVTGASNYTGGWASINEFRVFKSVNLALNKPITFSAQQAGNEASNIVDGSAGTKWSAETYPQWVQIDLGQNTLINKTELAPYQNRAYQYKIEVSTDGTNYTQVVNRTANTEGSTVLMDTFSAVTARYVRLTVTGASNYTGGWVSINEFGVYQN
ncbi:glycoside hydrolase family 2 [Paenibacillus mucilaginosus]|uniref:beta-galactosidase n=1 Tax=Paenibacillus mucilaginosus (strain KNP414) TaxID=1036673 RepID=F8FHP1_PAEMK|nr:glycoside hydrolase family 2 [Paenibacillus mucilaginosus]AEI42748.1 Glycosyl hydrolases family 2, immunoglobulin-like beta-sandwich domain protein [Paenibacillus mucilaginosus KNP414]MCG7216842.1 glycoside hydrolase family 2 [Paenibacillus mucilaginosus]WDM30942.1 glycoside hydrolase family 2 [Paenibacillus mucilaginosus]